MGRRTLSNKYKNKLFDILKNSVFRVVIIILFSIVVFGSIIIIVNKTSLSFDKDITALPYASINSKQIRINEYIISNNNTFRDADWNSPDWIELYNFGPEPIWLGDIYLSDDVENPEKFLLPDMTIIPNEYLLILASGKTKTADDYIRVPFKLGKNDEYIFLFHKGKTIDVKEIEYLPTDISAGYGTNDIFGYFAQATPGLENNTQLYESYDITPVNKYKDIIIINEYLSSNTNNITDYDGEHYDWIELYNPNENSVFMGNMFLSDDENQPDKFKLPDIELQGNDYLIIYASGKISNQNQIHAPFKIGPNDKKIILSYKNGSTINYCVVYNLPIDISNGIGDNAKFGFFDVPTPGKKNDTKISDSMDISANYISSSPILINEWMSNNRFGILDADGDASDWLELYNPSYKLILLDGYALTDNHDNLFKWTFPNDTTIPPNGYLLIFASGKNNIINGQIHMNFALGNDEVLYLVEPNASIADSVELEYLSGNVSKGRVEDGYGYFSLPTPGVENTTAYANQIDEDVSFVLGEVYISEVSSSSINYNKYKNKSVYEYIELYNRIDKTINLSGYSISEEGKESYIFEDTFIKPNQYLLIALKGYVWTNINSISITGFSLNSAGERIILRNTDGIIIDYFDTGYLLGDYSSGRIIGDEYNRVFFKKKTPGKQNDGDIFTSYSNKPIFSHEGGMIDESIILSISADSDTVIYYTLNGNMPNYKSMIYTEPISIDKDTIVRAVALSPDKLLSLSTSKTYILDRKHDIAIVCLASSPRGLFDNNQGIYADGPGHDTGEYPYFESNYFKDLECPVSFEYYQKNGQIGVAFDAGIQIAGGYTRAVSQKSLVIRLRDEYGLSQVEYPFFDDGASTFKHIYLRNAGQDGWKTKIRDCFIQNSVRILGTVDTKRGHPVAVYINGQYWGLYNLRDKLNDDHLATKYDLDQDEINIISEYSAAKKGSNIQWLELRDFCLKTDFRLQENYDILAEQIDVESFMDYIIMQTFFGNVDTHNINFWKADSSDSKWRPLLFDMDLSVRGVDYSMINMYFSSNLGFHSHIIKALRRNDGFRQQFLYRYAYILNNIFTEEYFNGELDLLADEIRNEMLYHVDRWKRPKNMNYWQLSMDTFKTGVIKRRYEAVAELKAYFDLNNNTIDELFPWYQNK